MSVAAAPHAREVRDRENGRQSSWRFCRGFWPPNGEHASVHLRMDDRRDARRSRGVCAARSARTAALVHRMGWVL